MATVAPQVRFVDGGAGIARRIAYLTQGHAWPVAAPAHRLVFTRLGERERRIADALAARGFVAAEAL